MQDMPHTRILNRREFQLLINHSKSPGLSLFLPTHRTGREQRQDGIRLRNLLAEAEKDLLGRDMPRAEVESLLEPIEDLLADDVFWRHQSDGLAVFRSPDLFRRYCLPLRFEEELIIENRFYVRPLLPLLHSCGRFFVLALSQDSARLLEATRDSIHELDLPEIARAEVDGADPTLQFHTPRRGTRPTSDEAIYHGHGGPEERAKVDLLNYFHRLNEAVTTVLEGEDAPLLLACVGYLAPIYEKANSYSKLLKVKVPGNPKMWTDNELRQQSWTFVEPHFMREQQASLAAVGEAAASGRAATDICEAVVAARRGQIDTLLLVPGRQQWGWIDPQLEAVHLTDRDGGDIELLDYAAAETLNHGGNVFVVDDVPGTDSALAGSMRY